MSDDLVERLRPYIGTKGPVQRARHPVNAPAIADWCDAMGDDTARYAEVAPAATLDIWDRIGMPGQCDLHRTEPRRTTDDPRAVTLKMFDAAGFVGVVAVNSELEIVRPLRPGDLLQNTQILEDISEQKQTALGVGHFVTTRSRYTTVDGEHVGDLLFRILKFKPGTGSAGASAATDQARPAPDSSPALRPQPATNNDNQAIWDGYRKRELRLSQCQHCQRVFSPPAPRCSACGSFDIGYMVSAGRGTLYSYTVVHHPQVPGFRYPLPVALVELDEGPRIVSNLVGVPPDDITVGMPLVVDWLRTGEDAEAMVLPQFRPVTPARRTEPLAIAEVSEGDKLPLWVLPVIPTLIVAGALATRDFQDVHHDRDLAHAKGSADIFLNINTSLGLMQRYVTDWAGPAAQVKALRVRLGAPAYPYQPLTFTGSVQSVDAGNGRVVVGVRASNDLGPHVTGTVELELA